MTKTELKIYLFCISGDINRDNIIIVNVYTSLMGSCR